MIRSVILLLFSSVFLTNCQPQSSSLDDPKVIIISLDGFPADALWDEMVALPTLRKLATDGAWSSSMIVSNPSLTWPNHTTLVTGVHPEKHHLTVNGRIVHEENGRVWSDNDRDRAELVHPDVETLYDLAHRAGLSTAEINWPATRRSPTLDDHFPDAPESTEVITPRLKNELLEKGILEPDHFDASWLGGRGTWSDWMWTESAAHLIEERQPDLLLLHLLNTDSSHHEYGPGSTGGNNALAYADTRVARILEALETAGTRESTTIFIVSDHGFVTVNHQLYPNRLFREAGLLDLDDEGTIRQARVQALSISGAAYIFFSSDETEEEDKQRVRDLLMNREGILDILTPNDYAEYGLPSPDETDQIGDLFLLAEPGYAFDNTATGVEWMTDRVTPGGSHGYWSELEPSKTIFIASGYQIESGLELGRVDNRSVAPTAADILGLEMSKADSPPLQQLFP